MATITAGDVFPVNATYAHPGGTTAKPATSYGGTFIPTLWSGKLAQKFYASTVFGEIANTDWQGEISGIGDTVIINKIPTITIADYSVGLNLQYQVPSPETLTLKITKGKYFGVVVNDVMEMQSKPKLMDMFTNDAAMQMKIQIDADVTFGTFNGGAATNKGATAGKISASYNLGTDLAPISLTAANIIEKITQCSSVLDEANVPETDRFLVITPFERNLLMTSNLSQAQFMGDSTSILRNGKIGMIDRFTVYVSNLLPRGDAGEQYKSGTGVNDGVAQASALKRHAVMFGHKSAITFASQVSKVETLQNPNDFGELVRGLNVYGFEVTQNDALGLLNVAG